MIRSFEGDSTNTMLLALNGEEIAGLSTITSSHKIKSRHDAELGVVVSKNIREKESASHSSDR